MIPFVIAGSGACLPERVITNAELAERLDTSDEWIVSRTGIRERRWVEEGQSTSDLGVGAVRAALEDAGVEPAEVDLLVCATSSPDWMQPATAAAIHGGSGLPQSCGAMDVNVVCSGFVFALHAAASMLHSTPSWSHVVVVGAECYSRILNMDDRETAVFFGDGAGAVVLTRDPSGGDEGLLGIDLGNDFSGADALVVPGGGARQPLTAELLAAGRNFFHMDGRAVWNFATRRLPESIGAACGEAEVEVGTLDVVIPHQSNLRMIERAMDTLGLPTARAHTTLERYGNTAGASIPITLDDARAAGRLAMGSLVCLSGYGGGLSWGSAVIRL